MNPLREHRFFRWRSIGLGLLGLCLTIGGGASTEEDRFEVVDLKCEYRSNPLGTAVERPGLSWRLESDVRGQRQVAYQILVASSEDSLDRGVDDLWDSGREESSRSIHVEYAGRPLCPAERCFWKVRAWPDVGDPEPSPWSDTAWWETALMSPDRWRAVWINDGRENPTEDADFFKPDPAPLFRKSFELPGEVRRARLYITGLGYYDAWINGKPVGDQELDPGWTDYSKRVYYTVRTT